MLKINRENLYEYLCNAPHDDLLEERYEIHYHTHLHQALRNNDLRSIEVLLERTPALCNETDILGQTPLHYAIIFNASFSTIQKVAENSSKSINVADNFLGIAFAYVLYKDQYKIDDVLKVLEVFAEYGANFETSNIPLLKTVMKRFENDDRKTLAAVIGILIKCSVDVQGEYTALESYLNENPKMFNMKTTGKNLLFLDACKTSNLEELKFYVNAGAEYNIVSDSGQSPLIIFLTRMEREKIDWFISLKNVDPTLGHNSKKLNALSLVLLSRMDGDIKLIELMLQKAKDVNKRFTFFSTYSHPLYYAIKDKRLPLLRLVCSYGYVNDPWQIAVDVSKDKMDAHPLLKLITQTKPKDNKTHYMVLDAMGYLIYENVFSYHQIEGIVAALYQVLLQNNFNLNQVGVINALTLMIFAHSHPVYVQCMNQLLAKGAKPGMMNIKIQRNARFVEKVHIDWEYICMIRELTLMPDGLLISYLLRTDTNITKFLDSWCCSSFVLRTLMPNVTSNFAYDFLMTFPAFADSSVKKITDRIPDTYRSTGADLIPIGSDLGIIFYRQLRKLLFSPPYEQPEFFEVLRTRIGEHAWHRSHEQLLTLGEAAKLKYAELDLNPSSLQDLARFKVQQNCAKMQNNGEDTYAEYIFNYVPWPYRHIFNNNDSNAYIPDVNLRQLRGNLLPRPVFHHPGEIHLSYDGRYNAYHYHLRGNGTHRFLREFFNEMSQFDIRRRALPRLQNMNILQRLELFNIPPFN